MGICGPARRSIDHDQPSGANAMHPKRVAIVVGGAGARGGYEAGALSVLVPRLRAAGCEPRVYVGVGVGAITATPLAASADLPPAEQARAVLELWRGVSVSEVYRPPLLTLPGAAARLIGQLVRLPGVRPTRLLDTAPLRRTVQRAIDQQRLRDNIADKGFTLAVVTTSSTDDRTVVFVDRSADATFRRGMPRYRNTNLLAGVRRTRSTSTGGSPAIRK